MRANYSPNARIQPNSQRCWKARPRPSAAGLRYGAEFTLERSEELPMNCDSSCAISCGCRHARCHFERSEKSLTIFFGATSADRNDLRFLAALEMTAFKPGAPRRRRERCALRLLAPPSGRI